jgi:hypothetical protein
MIGTVMLRGAPPRNIISSAAFKNPGQWSDGCLVSVTSGLTAVLLVVQRVKLGRLLVVERGLSVMIFCVFILLGILGAVLVVQTNASGPVDYPKHRRVQWSAYVRA